MIDSYGVKEQGSYRKENNPKKLEMTTVLSGI
jgi:hypothetical protein